MSRAIVSLSGGLDSTTVLAHVLDSYQRPEDVLAVGFCYGSKHNALENRAAARAAAHYGVPFRLIDLSAVMKGFPSTLMADGPPVPEGHYEAETMRQTVVPGRNLIFLSILAGIAESLAGGRFPIQHSTVWLGIHQGDHHIYPDCRPEWAGHANEVVLAGSDKKVLLMTPFIMNGKAEILRCGLRLRVPYHLTRTCYTSDPVACGRCGSCQERLAAFREAGAEDPLPYQSKQIFPKKPVKSDK
jgi:7-cyano-7-deazaguanine synthase